MFTLQRLNVVRIVETEVDKIKLIGQGFKEIATEVKEEVKKVEEKVTKGKAE